MTAAQEQAINLIRDIMREHFDAGVIAARVTDENGRSSFPILFGGHLSEVIGLTHMAAEAADMRFRMRKVVDLEGEEEDRAENDEADYE